MAVDKSFRRCAIERLRLRLQHFGPFVDGLQRAYRVMCVQPDVRCVSYRDVADWLDAQTPATIRSLQALPPA